MQLAGEALALFRRGQPGDLAGEPSIGDRRRRLVGDGPQTVAVAVGEEPLHRALGDEEPDLLVTDPHRRADDALRPGRGRCCGSSMTTEPTPAANRPMTSSDESDSLRCDSIATPYPNPTR